MELTDVNVCRLCAKNRYLDEIVGQISNETLKIETKLIACCRWDAVTENTCDKLTQNVCISCYQHLEQCWNFSEQVKNAQLELISKLVDKMEADEENDDKKDTSTTFTTSTQSNSAVFQGVSTNADDALSGLETETVFASDGFETIDCFIKTEDIEWPFCDDQHVDLEITENIKCEDGTDSKLPIHQNCNERTFNLLKAIDKDDRNSDGTVKLEAVQRLSLDDWTLMQYHCYLCKLQLPDRYEWRNHIKVEHPDQPYRHLCNICNAKDYKTRKPLVKHIIAKHRNYFKYCCRRCNLYYWDLERLRNHSVQCSRAQSKSSLCDICGREFKNGSVLRIHRDSHSFRRIFECFMCNKQFLSRNNLKHHTLVSHISNEPQFKCNICGKGFARKTRFNRHMKTHTNVFPFECPHCVKKFRFREKLVTHIRTHTGERPFKCALCEYRCGDSANICKHMKQKHGITKTELRKRVAVGDKQ